jgi:hypothetical protein
MTVGADGPHEVLILICQYVGVTCMIILLTLVLQQVCHMWNDINNARQSTGVAIARQSSIRFTVAKLSCCLLTLVTCLLFSIAPFFGHQSDTCFDVVSAAAFFYVVSSIIYISYHVHVMSCHVVMSMIVDDIMNNRHISLWCICSIF